MDQFSLTNSQNTVQIPSPNCEQICSSTPMTFLSTECESPATTISEMPVTTSSTLYPASIPQNTIDMCMELNIFWSEGETTDISWPYSTDNTYETESYETLKDGKILESLLTWESTSGEQANAAGRTREDSGYITYPSWTISPTPTIGSTTDWTSIYTTCPMHAEPSCSSAISRSVSTTGAMSESINGVTTPRNRSEHFYNAPSSPKDGPMCDNKDSHLHSLSPLSLSHLDHPVIIPLPL